MKPYAVRLTARALPQLETIYSYIAEHGGPARAERFVDGIIADCFGLSTFPERGTKRDDIWPHLRTKSYRRRVIVAFVVKAEMNEVVVNGIFYGGQDFEAQLQDRQEDV